MRVRILNKNKYWQTPSIYVERYFEIDEGAVFSETKNETLDTATIIISNLEEPLEIEPYDIVEIIKNNSVFWKYMCVDTYTEQMICINPKLYRYEITLFSETKQLENIILPNLKISQVSTKPSNDTIYERMYEYFKSYCPKVRIKDGQDSYSYDYKWTWETLEDKFSDECPEMQWNTPTLREVLNDLMMVKDCIPVIKDGDITYMDLTKVGQDISKDTHINYITKSRSSEDYVSEIQMKLENLTSNTKTNRSIVTKSEFFVFDTPEEDAVSATNNISVKTKYPIYKLKSLKMMFPVAYRDDTGLRKWVEMDLCNLTADGHTFSLVSEYQEWITKGLHYGGAPSDFWNWANYQNYSFYYKRGSNEITNFTANETILVFSSALLSLLLLQLYQLDHGSIGNADPPRWYNIMFSVEYETLEGCVFRASKGEYPDNEKVIIDNQTNSYVDSYAQGILEYMKANRLGNEQLQINARYPSTYTGHQISISDIYKTEDGQECVVYQCEYQIYKDHTEVNAIATKGYILRDYYTGIRSKIRSWPIVSGNEALSRNDIVKYYCEFSYTPHNETDGLGSISSSPISEYLTSSLTNYSSAPLKASFIRTQSSQGYKPKLPSGTGVENRYYLIDLVSRVIGNSLVFSVGFDDNYWAGKSYYNDAIVDINYSANEIITYQKIYVDGATIKADVDVNGGIPTYQHRYTDDAGECYEYEIVFTNGIHTAGEQYSNVDGNTEWASHGSLDTITNQSHSFIWHVYQRPVTYEHNIKSTTYNYDYEEFRMSCYFYKDSQEIQKISTQFEFCSDTTDICICKAFLSRQKAINYNENSNSDVFKLYRIPKSQYNYRKPDEQYEDAVELDVESIDIDTSNSLNAEITICFDDGGVYQSQELAKSAAKSYRDLYAFYLAYKDEDNVVRNLLLFKDIPDDNCTGVEINTDEWFPAYKLNMNILRTRNKNIYDDENRYLIVDKI